MKPEVMDEEDYESLEEERELDTKYLVFSVGEKEFAIRIRHITEIVNLLPITELPDMPEYLLGIVNLRGRGIPVIDARIRLASSLETHSLAPAANSTQEKSVVVIVEWKESSYGLIVDGVREVVTIPEDCKEPAVDFQTGSDRNFTEGLARLGDSVKILLNLEKFIG